MYQDQDSRYSKSNDGLHPEQRQKPNRTDHRNNHNMHTEESYVRGGSPHYRRDDRIGRDYEEHAEETYVRGGSPHYRRDYGEHTQMGTRGEQARYNDRYRENTQMAPRGEQNRYTDHRSYKPRFDVRKGFQHTINARHEGNRRGFDASIPNRRQYATGAYNRHHPGPRGIDKNGYNSNRQYRTGSGPYGVGREHVESGRNYRNLDETRDADRVNTGINYGTSDETRDTDRMTLGRKSGNPEENPTFERMGIVRCEYETDKIKTGNIQSDDGTDTDVCEKKRRTTCKITHPIECDPEASPKRGTSERDNQYDQIDAIGDIDDNEDYVP
jgi:hypothetical protein